MATSKKSEITIEEMTIVTMKTIIDPSMIKLDDKNHTFQLEPGAYQVEVQIEAGRQGTRTRIKDISDNAIQCYSTSHFIYEDFTAQEGHDYAIEYFAGRAWQPVQTLDPDRYTVTLTLIR